MLSITHTAIGATIAHYAPQPFLYIPGSLIMHYLGDWIPHWDCGTGLGDKTKAKSTAIVHELIDLVFSIFFLWIVFDLPQQGIQWHIWVAAFVSLVPDFLEAPKNFLGYEPRVLSGINAFHDKFHGSTKDMIVGLLPQLIILFGVYLLS